MLFISNSQPGYQDGKSRMPRLSGSSSWSTIRKFNLIELFCWCLIRFLAGFRHTFFWRNSIFAGLWAIPQILRTVVVASVSPFYEGVLFQFQIRLTGLHSSKLQTLFYIGTSNFIFPLFLNIALLVHAFRYSDQVITGSYVLLSSFYVQIIGVLLATVWAAGVQWTEEKFHFTVPTVVLPTMSQSSSGGEISISDRDSDSRMRTHPNDDTKSDT